MDTNILYLANDTDSLREREMTLVRFSNSTKISGGLMLSGSPHCPEMSRVLNVSQTSTEDVFVRDLERELFNKTPSQYLLDTEPSHLIYRLDKVILGMDKQKIQDSTDDLSRLILNVWNE